MPMEYVITVQGHLDDQWSAWFEGLTITREAHGETMLVGSVADQTALHGLLIKIRDLGLPLIGVIRSGVSDGVVAITAAAAALPEGHVASMIRTIVLALYLIAILAAVVFVGAILLMFTVGGARNGRGRRFRSSTRRDPGARHSVRG